MAAQPGHEYTKSNVRFAISVLQSDPVKQLRDFAETNQETQGKFTIADEKVCMVEDEHVSHMTALTPPRKKNEQNHNVFMRPEDPVIQKATGETDPVKIMTKLREMKNNFK